MSKEEAEAVVRKIRELTNELHAGGFYVLFEGYHQLQGWCGSQAMKMFLKPIKIVQKSTNV